ncbi:MAG TPA: heme exporter protein CcmD [Alphaproteobacteria bacterium]|nr:heme exporter protein CcmD [Alphaproteobacteria bacterium]
MSQKDGPAAVDSIVAFLEMGGRAQFVWPAYGLTAAVLVGLLVVSLRAMRAHERELDRFEARRPRRERRS